MQYAIIVESLSHAYDGKRALDNVSLSLPMGKTVGLVGPDGVGKSTLLALMAGVKKLQSGRMTVLGGDVADATFRRELAPRVAYMPQGLGRNLYRSLSVYDNIDFSARLFGVPPAERDERIQRLMRATALDPFPRPTGWQALGRHEAKGVAVRGPGAQPGFADSRRAHHRCGSPCHVASSGRWWRACAPSGRK
jgi:ribosome-dependent ATPase